ncbi:MAG: hypothetical protein P8O83_01450 [Flavobacteriaceae bacterium]|nr:hypothetical protein [Flavobacteriaceae bacterium]
MVTLHVITPYGGLQSELAKTYRSIQALSDTLNDVKLHWIVVLNNGAEISLSLPDNQNRLMTTILNLNPTACRSKARNAGLAHLKKIGANNSDFLQFLDSGDLISGDLISEISQLTNVDMIIGEAEIISEKRCWRRKQPSLRLMRIINTIYLGTVLIKLGIAGKVAFQSGRKEDWKYWIEILRLKPSYKFSAKLAYSYTIKSKVNHGMRKFKLLSDQYKFFRNYLNDSRFMSSIKLILHYTINLYLWLRA